MSRPAKLTGIRALLEGKTINRVDMTPSGTGYRLWTSGRGGERVLCEINTDHIFDELGRYVRNDITDD